MYSNQYVQDDDPAVNATVPSGQGSQTDEPGADV